MSIRLTVLAALMSLMVVIGAAANKKNKLIGGQYYTGVRVIPSDPNAPFCVDKEPCGFYTFDIRNLRPIRWVPSWCQCPTDCVFTSQDYERKLYVHTCSVKSAEEDTDEQ